MLLFQYTAGNYQQHNNSNAHQSNSYSHQGNDGVFVLFWNLKEKKKKKKSHLLAINDSACTPLQATKEPLTTRLDREEKSSRHVTIVEKCLDNNKPKIHLKK